MSSSPENRFLDEIENDSANSSILMDVNNSKHLRLDELEEADEHTKMSKKLFYSSPHREKPIRNRPVHDEPLSKNNENERGVQAPVREIIINKDTLYDKEEIQPWEFNKVIRKGYKEKLPTNYDLKKWRRPSKTMVNSVIQLLENNIEYGIEGVMNKYKDELEAVTNYNQREIKKVYKQKQSIMDDIVSKIKQRLAKSKFPSRLADKDLDIEYIFAKRKFIQSRYIQELENAERVETELIKSQAELIKLRDTSKKLMKNNRKRLVEKLIDNNLHSSLSKSISNSFNFETNTDSTVLNDTDNNNHSSKFSTDLYELNLEIDLSDDAEEPQMFDTITMQKDRDTNASLYLPSLESYEQTSNKLSKTINSILELNHNKEFKKLNNRNVDNEDD
ncbi:hypothetical protein TPHA_0E03190 [Tetrapisispora phaffii CBS 4417]|uniref:Uncharacterized protein n=1 Tax=Tetrapisispora phaffii (strain ATCC 24235 / CBS 4417 / NBRC 1672 / NRRL Y-8282 / UCD 70-5) TaxID=1071381 RepID=G8BU31_TETPH|nr:hypothetical protein TPHA_0E03190 [Tetrapisispora phaffii CBS 4417]CCE63409.1 hypothetical protein TPHA_0E03190 [Tetrapisispora phaffii CBS 4417]